MFASQYDYDFTNQEAYLCVERVWSIERSESHHVMIDTNGPFYGHEPEINTFTASVYVGPCDGTCREKRQANLKTMMPVGDELRRSLIQLFNQVDLSVQHPSVV